MFEAPKDSEFTQGTIFSCAYAENYLVGPVYGLVITARCDAAQEKAPIFSYVPVVPLTSWIFLDGALLALDRIEADLMNSAKSIVKTNSLSESLLKTHSLSKIYDAHFRQHEGDRKKSSQCEKMKAIISRHAEAVELREALTERERLVKFFAQHSGIVDGLIKEMAGNRLAGYYLLLNLETLGEQNGQPHVALLREVHHIPTQLARDIANGMVPPMNTLERRSQERCPRFNSVSDVAMPLGRLRSPWIEHLMQNFSLLFSRIGIPDVDVKSLKEPLRALGIGA